MNSAPRSMAGRWLYAAKPASWPKLLVPALLGQALGVAATGRVDLRALGVGLAFTVLDLMYVVFLNDWGDRKVDAVKRRMFPQGSPKTIPDGILDSRALMWAAVLAGVGAAVLAFYGGALLGRPYLGWCGVLCLSMLVGYTLPPIKLNYRGGGELLEMVGVGVALPWFNLYLQSGQVWTKGMWIIPGFMLLSLASAVASGLADEVSDRAGGKQTFTTSNGNPAARKVIERLLLLGAVVLAIGTRLCGIVPAPLAALAVAAVAINWYRLRKVGPLAVTNAFESQARYKDLLHKAIWRSTTMLALFIVAWALWNPR